MLAYSELCCLSNFSFLQGASHPQELVKTAHALGYRALALSDECSLAGMVKAYQAAKECDLKLISGSHFHLSNGETLVVLAPTRVAYAELSGFITLARRRSAKGQYEAHLSDLRFRLQHCLILWLANSREALLEIPHKHQVAQELSQAFPNRLWLALSHRKHGSEKARFLAWRQLAEKQNLPLVACGSVLMHEPSRKPLQDVLHALHENTSVQALGAHLHSNGEAYLKSLDQLQALYPMSMLEETQRITELCTFSMKELCYQYPSEVVPLGESPIAYLTRLVREGCAYRWPQGPTASVNQLIQKELKLIEEMGYEYYFLTVYDIVQFARRQDILCQGRGSAANSIVCYCLRITEISPDMINVLFERFISKERNEPPDIDVDFEHERREEVVQYIYRKYGRERAALAATVICYRPRSAIRDVGKALGLDAALIDHLAKSLSWWDKQATLLERMAEAGLQLDRTILQHFFNLVQQLLGFPRHLSQHVGGFVITQDTLSDIVPVENAAMAERTVIQWDKEDLEVMGLMKVDVLALGMLTAIRKALSYVSAYDATIQGLDSIPKEDSATYAMLCKADSVGVFQVESRAQMSMLPRLQPKQFYDLVIQIAIVRPGPIQGGMVHPYLKRRHGLENVSYYNEALKEVLSSTLGVPIFQEQAIRLAMVAAGFSGGEADALRRAMASWGKNGHLLQFEERFIQGMLNNGYPLEFAHRLFEQIKGFGGYGFPESHSASFALLCYFSSWLKCHHPAAFYCALLNSQPMGFYSASQLLQDARRHHLKLLPLDINRSGYEHTLENVAEPGRAPVWGIRLGFVQIKALDKHKSRLIEDVRGERDFVSLADLQARSGLTRHDLELLASADVLHSLQGQRYNARWAVQGLESHKPLFNALDASVTKSPESLTTQAPHIQEDILRDLQRTRVSLRPHIMVLLRQQKPFQRCKRQIDLATLHRGCYVQVAGLVTGRQRPGTAKGTVFVTLEDETGNINVVVWARTLERYRREILSSRLLLVKGSIDCQGSVIHVIAGQIMDYSHCLPNISVNSRDFH